MAQVRRENVPVAMVHSHEQEKVLRRTLIRICITIDSLLRERLGLPSDSSLSQPYPISSEIVLRFLRTIVTASDTVSECTEDESEEHNAS